jgi:hypothetical protein
MALGTLFMLPFYAGFVIMKIPSEEWLTPFWIISTITVSLFGGSLLGLWLRSGARWR